MPHVLRRCLFWLGAITLALPHWAYAESAQSPAPVVGTSGHLLSMTVGLLLIIVLIFALAWLLRRFGQGGLFMQQKSIKIVAALALGTRERIVVVDVGGKQILLGVTAREINTLYVFDEPVIDAESLPASSEFSRKLMAVLNKKSGGGK